MTLIVNSARFAARVQIFVIGRIMATPATMLRRVEEIDRLPDGVYDGVWGGYVVRFAIDGIDYEAQTKDGIRTPRAECKITITDGNLSVEVAR